MWICVTVACGWGLFVKVVHCSGASACATEREIMVRAAFQNRQVSRPKLNQKQCKRADRVVVRAKLLSKSVIPAFIARNEMMDQMDRWIEIEVQNEGITNFGIACTYEQVQQDDDLWGFKIHMERVSPISTTSGC